jgi:hypothetical protein
MTIGACCRTRIWCTGHQGALYLKLALLSLKKVQFFSGIHIHGLYIRMKKSLFISWDVKKQIAYDI